VHQRLHNRSFWGRRVISVPFAVRANARRSPLAFVPALVAGARHERHEESHEEEEVAMVMVVAAAEEGSFICRGSVNGPGVKLADDNTERGPAREWAPAILRTAEPARARARALTPT